MYLVSSKWFVHHVRLKNTYEQVTKVKIKNGKYSWRLNDNFFVWNGKTKSLENCLAILLIKNAAIF